MLEEDKIEIRGKNIMTNIENQSKGRLDKLNMKKLAHIVKERKNNQAL